MHACPTIPSLGTVLGVWAHPDDEAYLSAGLMALARRHGQRVVVVTATAGEAGGASAGVRRRELAASLAVLGVSEHRALGLPDGGCAEVDEALGSALVRRVIEDVRPDTIVTFGPDGMTGHPDHRAVSAWTTAAWRAARPDGATGSEPVRLWYATLTAAWHTTWAVENHRAGLWGYGSEPPCTAPARLAAAIECAGELAATKRRALEAHASQTGALVRMVGPETFGRWFASEWFVAAPAA
jgi:LmbE family N-acetylglucosaminyl deacetylase